VVINKSKYLVIVGVVLVLVGIGGSLISAADLLGVSFTSYEEWEQSQGEEGFIPLALPLEVSTDGLEFQNPPLPTAPPEINQQPSAPTSNEREAATPRPTPTRIPVIPDRLIIPAINLDAPITPAKHQQTRIGGNSYEQWLAPDKFAVGWHTNSAVLGQEGNTVLNGHHNIEGKVFKDLHLLKAGNEIILTGGNIKYRYQVVNLMILPERNVDVKTRLENARWILPSEDERITLVTCWPDWSNTHRLIVVAQPVGGPLQLTSDAIE
jgi:sortase A